MSSLFVKKLDIYLKSIRCDGLWFFGVLVGFDWFRALHSCALSITKFNIPKIRTSRITTLEFKHLKTDRKEMHEALILLYSAIASCNLLIDSLNISLSEKTNISSPILFEAACESL